MRILNILAVGLTTTGIVAAILFFQFGSQLTHYDNAEYADELYRLNYKITRNGSEVHTALTPKPLAYELLKGLTAINGAGHLEPILGVNAGLKMTQVDSFKLTHPRRWMVDRFLCGYAFCRSVR